jgi:hypothetical protein
LDDGTNLPHKGSNFSDPGKSKQDIAQIEALEMGIQNLYCLSAVEAIKASYKNSKSVTILTLETL